MKFRSAFAVLSMTVALTACGELPFQKSLGDEAAVPAHSGPPAVSPLDQPIEVGAEAIPVSTAESNTMATAIFRAAGPGWVATAADTSAVYERPGAKSTGVKVRRMTYGRGVEFVGTMNGQVFSLNVQSGDCIAGDEKTPFTARLRVGSQRLTGCAIATDTMPKAQVQASSASPKPKSAPKAAAPAAKPAAAPAAAVTPEAETPAVSTPAETPAATTAPAVTAPASTDPVTSSALPPEEPSTATPTTPSTPAPAAPEAASTPSVPAPQMVLPPEPPSTTE